MDGMERLAFTGKDHYMVRGYRGHGIPLGSSRFLPMETLGLQREHEACWVFGALKKKR